MKWVETWHCRTPSGTHLMGQAPIERLKADDPCWRGEVWKTLEPKIEPIWKHGLPIKVKDGD